jgi:hypothetical protein
MVAIFVACHGVGLPLSVANGNFQRRPGFYLALLLAFTAFMVVGAVIVAHRPGNPIGWLFSAIGLLTATGALALEYAEYAYVTRPGSLPGAVLAAWYQWWWLPMFALILVFIPLLFPTGRLLSVRWSPVAVVAAAATTAIAVLGAAGALRTAARRRPGHHLRTGRRGQAVHPRRRHQHLEPHPA